MEENKILEFVREFNAGLENSNEYNNLQYQNDGYQEGLLLPHIYVWSDDEGQTDFKQTDFKQKALSSLFRQLSELIIVVSPLLDAEIKSFFAEKKKIIKMLFPKTTLKYYKESNLEYSVNISGVYNEEDIEEFAEALEEDFKWIFNGLKIIDIMYS